MITANMVKELREQTGAGMLDCKKALTETNGNMEGLLLGLEKKELVKLLKSKLELLLKVLLLLR